MARDEAKRLTTRQRDALVTALIWAAKNIAGVGAIPPGAISDSSWARFLELGLAQRLGKDYRLTERGAELAARIAAKSGPGNTRRTKGASTASVTAWVDDAEKAYVRSFAADCGETEADVVRRGLRAIGALP
jgi:hypothetical protein